MIEKLPNSQPILVRPKGDNILPGRSEIEVWQTQGKENRARVEAYSQDTIATPDEDGKNFKNKLRGQRVSVSEAYGKGQDALAAEYADLPLRTDTILAEVNGKVVDAKVYDYVKAEDGTLYGAVIDNEGNTAVVHVDGLRAEVQKELHTSRQGEAVLEAVGVKEPGLSPWSQEAADIRREASLPTFENPQMFDSMEDAIESVEFSQTPGEILHGAKMGWFNRGGSTFFLIEPDAESRTKAEYSGKYMIVPADFVSARTIKPEKSESGSQIQEAVEQNGASMQPESKSVDLFDELPPEIQAEVSQYRDAVQSKRDAESEKDYAGAADAGRWIYSTGKRISKQAQDFVGFKL